MQTIDQLKKSLIEHRQIAKNQKNLLQSREELEIERQALRMRIEIDTLALHRHRFYRQSQAEDLAQALKDYKKRLIELEKNIVTLEKTLEQSDHENFDSIDQEITEQLIESILEQIPHTKQEYLNLMNEKQIKENVLQDFLTLKAHFETIFLPFKEGEETLRSAKKRGFFDYFFGRHPTVVLAQKIHTVHQNANVLLSLLTTSERQVLSDFHKKILIFLNKIIYESNKRWNNDLYNEKFLSFFSESQDFLSALHLHIDEVHQEIGSLKKKISKLLDIENLYSR